MKRGLISLLIAIFFGFLVFIILLSYSPLDTKKIEEIINLYGVTEEAEFREILQKSIDLGLGFGLADKGIISAWILACMGFVVSLFSAIHMFIDKLFFKQYFQQPNLIIALRRGFFLFLVLFVFFILRLLGAFEWYTAVIAFALFVLLELLFVYLNRRKTNLDKFKQ